MRARRKREVEEKEEEEGEEEETEEQEECLFECLFNVGMFVQNRQRATIRRN